MVKKKKKQKRKNPWIDHIKKYQSEHPDKSWGECMAESKPELDKRKGK